MAPVRVKHLAKLHVVFERYSENLGQATSSRLADVGCALQRASNSIIITITNIRAQKWIIMSFMNSYRSRHAPEPAHHEP